MSEVASESAYPEFDTPAHSDRSPDSKPDDHTTPEPEGSRGAVVVEELVATMAVVVVDVARVFVVVVVSRVDVVVALVDVVDGLVVVVVRLVVVFLAALGWSFLRRD